MQYKSLIIGSCLAALLAGCSTTSTSTSTSSEHKPSKGGRYQLEHDIAPDEPLSMEHIEDAQPKYEPYSLGGNKNYSLLGGTYQIIRDTSGFRQRGKASWYGKKFHGHLTSNGEVYDMYSMTAAHKTLPLPSYVKVTNLDNNKTTVVRVNDRGPFHTGRIIDLSYAAATKIGVVQTGTANVEIEAINLDKPNKKNITLPPHSYIIQIASLKLSKNARTLAEELGLKLSVGSLISNNNGSHRVYLGPFTDPALAHSTLEKVKKLGYSTAFIKKQAVNK